MSNMEKYLNAIITGDNSNLPEPNSVIGKQLQHIAQNGTGTGGGGASGGGSENFPTLIDNITIEEEGVKEITLAIDLTICKEARFYISVPKNNSGSTINYYVASANVSSAQNMGWLQSYTDKATGTTVYYKGISETLGDFSFATGMQGSDIDKPILSGGSGNITANKAPRTVSDVTKLVWTNANTSFPIGTKVQTFMWG